MSHGQGFDNIYTEIRNLADGQPDVVFINPVNLNPNVQEPFNRTLGNHKRIHLIKTFTYDPFVWVMTQSHIVLTDSGGF